MARKVLDVFLSSTAEDLTEHRKAVDELLMHDGLSHCVRQEDFGAQDAGVIGFCRKKVQEADMFVGLIGLRRGWEPDGDNEKRSITEMEHDWAREAGRPRYLWVAPDDFPVPGNIRESDEEYARQMAFRKRVMGERVVSQKGFGSPKMLASEIVRQLQVQMITDLLKRVRPEGASPDEFIAAAVESLAEDKDVDLLALAKNPQGLEVRELVAKLLDREKELEEQANRIAVKRKEYWRHIGALASLSYSNETCEEVPALAPRTFQVGDKIEFLHRPGRVAKITKVWNPEEAAKEFPNGLRGAAKPPYRDGVVELSFEGRDALGREYPKEIVAGTSVQRV